MGLWGEIKQRRITQIVLAYLAGGWMLLAVVDQVVDREVLPRVFYTVALTIYVFGVGWALILGWYHGEKGAQKATFIEIVMLTVIAVAALGMSGVQIRSHMSTGARVASTMDLRRVAVLYFEDDSSDGSLEVVAEALTEGLIGALSEVRQLDVVSRNGARAVRGQDLAPDSVASIFQAGTLVTGSVSQAGSDLEVVVRFIDGESGVRIEQDRYEWPAGDLVALEQGLVTEVSQSLREVLGEEIRLRAGRATAPSTAAWLQLARAEKALQDATSAVQRGDDEAAAADLATAAAEAMAASSADESWVAPTVLRGRVAYESWALAETLEELVEALETAIALADEALAVEPNSAAALELRGTARYRLWLFQLDDEDVLNAMLEAARTDLERSLSLDRTRANASSVLSHLYYQVGDKGAAFLAARQAYEQDAFLSAADGVLWRLFQTSYDLGNHDDAQQWCLEGNRRFPDNFRFVQCQLYVLTMEQAQPDVDEAWRLYEEFASLLPEAQAPLFRSLGQTFLAGVIGKAGLQDSADAVLRRARAGRDVDPEGEQISMEAAMRSVYGDVEGAIESLERYMILNPGHFPDDHWWWQSLQGNPEFERLQTIR